MSGTVSELVWNDEVAEIYLGPTLTARMRSRFPRPDEPSEVLRDEQPADLPHTPSGELDW